ncbi:hypothetical protein [Demequina aurantiaca]|uniref:hypothetical protein n=1 Tax=Demequina aurantiaca TaxID=676200 RepID=UPI000785950B|nr:hypothetical protein [Demequina aurantiaca]
MARSAGGVRLSDAQVVELRERYAAGARQVELAEAFGVSQNTVSALVLGRTRVAAGGPIKVPASRNTSADTPQAAPPKANPRTPPMSTEQVDQIRNRVSAGESRADVATELGVSIHTVHSIMSGRRKGRSEEPERKFSEDDVIRMRTLFSQGTSQSDLAQQFDTQQQAISQIVRGQSYASYGGPVAGTA